MTDFKDGDVVLVTSPPYSGLIGTVKNNKDRIVCVEFSQYFPGFHDCDNAVPSGFGYMFPYGHLAKMHKIKDAVQLLLGK